MKNPFIFRDFFTILSVANLNRNFLGKTEKKRIRIEICLRFAKRVVCASIVYGVCVVLPTATALLAALHIAI